jgi:hypothetical protein
MKKKTFDQAGPKVQLEVCAIFEDMLSKTYRLSALIVLHTDSIDKNCLPDEKKNLLIRLGRSRSWRCAPYSRTC